MVDKDTSLKFGRGLELLLELTKCDHFQAYILSQLNYLYPPDLRYKHTFMGYITENEISVLLLPYENVVIIGLGG